MARIPTARKTKKSMQITPFRIAVFGLFGLLLTVSPLAHADATSLETAALLGGRIVGAAKACGINAERIRRTSERMLFVVTNKAASDIERSTATSYFAAGQSTGAEHSRVERSRCTAVHVDFSEIEVKLGRAPAVEKEALAARLGVPSIGALTK